MSKLLLKTLSKKEQEDLMIRFGIQTFESATDRIIGETIDTIKNNVADLDLKYVMLQFYLTINSLVKSELKEIRKTKKEEKAS